MKPKITLLVGFGFSLAVILTSIQCTSRDNSNPLAYVPSSYAADSGLWISVEWNDTTERVALRWGEAGLDTFPNNTTTIERIWEGHNWLPVDYPYPDDSVLYDNSPDLNIAYYYRIQIRGDSAVSDRYSPAVKFIRPPIDTSLNCLVTPTNLRYTYADTNSNRSKRWNFYWNILAQDYDGFQFQTRADAKYGVYQWRDCFLWQTSANGMSIGVTGLSYNTRHSARVRSITNSGQRSHWSNIARFDSGDPPPGSECGVMLSLPLDDSLQSPKTVASAVIAMWSFHGGTPHLPDSHPLRKIGEGIASTGDRFSLDGRGECFEELELAGIKEDETVDIHFRVRSLPRFGQELDHNLGVILTERRADDWKAEFLTRDRATSCDAPVVQPSAIRREVKFKRWYDVNISADRRSKT